MRRVLKGLYRGYVHNVLPQPQIVKRFISCHAREAVGGMGVEIGCGTSPFAETICQSFVLNRYLSTDIVPNDQTDIIADGAKLPFSDQRVGIVTGFQVLQHLSNHDAVLSEAARILQPNGLLLLTYPFMYGECDVHDIRRWTMEGMAADCKRAGFEIVAHQKIGGITFMMTSFLIALINQLVPGGRKSWRSNGSFFSALRIGLTTFLSFPFQLLGWGALLLDRAWPRTPFYMGGIVLARRIKQ